MPIELEIHGTRVVVNNGRWRSRDKTLQRILTSAVKAELVLNPAGYIPDIDLEYSLIAQRLFKSMRVVREDLPEETYPPDAVF